MKWIRVEKEIPENNTGIKMNKLIIILSSHGGKWKGNKLKHTGVLKGKNRKKKGGINKLKF